MCARNNPVVASPYHHHGRGNSCEQIANTFRLLSMQTKGASDVSQVRNYAVHAFIFQYVIDKLPAGQRRIGKQSVENRLDVLAAVRRDESFDILGVDLFAKSGRRDQRERGNPVRMGRRGAQSNCAAYGMAGEVHALEAGGVQEGCYRIGKILKTVILRELFGSTMAGQVKCINGSI